MNERLDLFFARPSVAKCNVEVMTIHQAKGLEFDVVLIPQLGRGTPQTEKSMLVWTEETTRKARVSYALPHNPRKVSRPLSMTRLKKRTREKTKKKTSGFFTWLAHARKNALHLFGSAACKEDGGLRKASSKTFLGLIWDSVKPLFESELRRRPAQQQNLVLVSPAGESDTMLTRMPATWRMPKFEMSVAWQPELQRAPAATHKVTYEWVGDTSRHVGTVVHELLKRIATEGVEGWNEARISASRALIRAELLRMGVPADEDAQATEQVIRALTNTLKSERGRWLLSRPCRSVVPNIQ